MTAPSPAPDLSPALPGSYLVIELTNRCSLACVHCSVSEEDHPHHARTGYLDPSLFFSLLDDLETVGGRFETLIPFWLGEPLLHPQFTELWRGAVRSAKRFGTFRKIEVHTNATHLTAERTRALLNDGTVPTVMHFSLDAASQSTYLKVKAVDRFEQVEQNVRHFIREKGRLGARGPRPVFQFIVGSNNVHEAGSFRQRWVDECRSAGVAVRVAAGHVPPGDDAVVFFRQLDCPTPEKQQSENAVFRSAMEDLGLALPAASKRGESVAAENLHACSGFWKSPVVSWQGELTTCTRDNLLENLVGDLRHERFSALWWGQRLEHWRMRVAKGDYAERPLCQTCFIPRSLNHSDLSDNDFAAHDVQRASVMGIS